MSTYTHKIGDTFALGGAFEYADADGNPLDPAGIVGASQLRTRSGSLIAEFDVTISSGICTVTQRSGDDSGKWPVGQAGLDVQFTLPGGGVVSTDTVAVLLVQDVTREP